MTTLFAPALLPAEEVYESNQTMTLRDGRALGFAQYGDPSGKPVFFFHGGAGSRLEHPADIRAIGARLICMDRPGHGLSDFKPDRELLEWPDDVAQLANYLGINKFFVLGWSAGGPHALACAYQLSDRVLAGAVSAGLAPMNRPGATKGIVFPGQAFVLSAQNFPWLVGLFRKMARKTIWGDALDAKRRLLLSVPDSDKERMIRSGNFDMWFSDVREGYRQGWQGAAHDDVIIMNDWGFDIADIEVRIDIWHGDQDRNIPIQASEYMRDRIPNNRTTILPGEGHLFLLNNWCRVVQSLIAG